VEAERTADRARRREEIDGRGPIGEQGGPGESLEPDQLRDRRMVEGNEKGALEEAVRPDRTEGGESEVLIARLAARRDRLP
jgi:hypothetical protein